MSANTLTLHEKYSLGNREDLPQQIQLHLSKKPKIISEFLAVFLKFRLNIYYFEKKTDKNYSICISEIIDCKGRGYLNV